MVDGNESWFSVSNQVNVTLSSSATSISEPTNSATLTATLDNTSSADVVVNLTYTGTATNATDYSGAASITISAGSLTGTTAITAIDDTDVELTETIIVDMGDVSGASESGTQQVTINLTDNDLPSVSSITVDKTSIDENGGVAVITATISDVQSKDVTIPLTVTGTLKWEPDATEGIVVAGGNTNGSELHMLNYVQDISVDDSGNIYVADFNNSRVMKWAPNAVQGVNVLGSVYRPISIELDSENNIYVSKFYRHTVDKYTLSGSTYSESTIFGTYNSSGSSLNQLSSPRGLHIDSTGNIYVSDQENHRIQKFQVNPEIKIASGDTTGTVTFTGIDDSTDEAGETIIVTPSTSPTNATSSISEASTITITDDDDPPSVTFAFSADSIEENSSTDVTLTATLSEASGQDVSIPYTISGTATITDEYTITASPINIAAGAYHRNRYYFHKWIR